MDMIKRLFKEEIGQGMTEYVLIITLISLIAIGIMTTYGQQIESNFTGANEKLVEAGGE